MFGARDVRSRGLWLLSDLNSTIATNHFFNASPLNGSFLLRKLTDAEGNNALKSRAAGVDLWMMNVAHLPKALDIAKICTSVAPPPVDLIGAGAKRKGGSAMGLAA